MKLLKWLEVAGQSFTCGCIGCRSFDYERDRAYYRRDYVTKITRK